MSLEQSIREKLIKKFNPVKLVVINQSSEHAGHAGSPGTGNSHFLIEIISSSFKGKNRVQAQRMVYAVLEEEMKKDIHALALTVSSS